MGLDGSVHDNEGDTRVVELGIDSDEETQGIVSAHAIHFQRTTVVVLNTNDNLEVNGSATSRLGREPDVHWGRAVAKQRALQRLRQLRVRGPLVVAERLAG
jgi:hypothetical protein